MHTQLHNVTMEVLEKCGVSNRQFEQIKMLMQVDKDIFNEKIKTHETHYTSTNLFDNFVDFTKLPHASQLPKEAKNLLYRPDKMKTLSEAYKSICRQLTSNHMHFQESKQLKTAIHHKKAQYEARFPKKN